MLRFGALTIALVASVACAFPQLYLPIVNTTTPTTEITISAPFAHTEISVPPFGGTRTSEEPPLTEHVESSIEVTSGFAATPYTAHIEASVTSDFPTETIVPPIAHTEITVTPPSLPTTSIDIVGVVSEPNRVYTEHIEFSITPEAQNTPGASTNVPEFAHTEIAVSQVQPSALSEINSPTTVGIGDITGSLIAGASISPPQSQPTVGIASPGQSSPLPVQGPPAVTLGTQAITLTPGFSTVVGTGSLTTIIALTTNSAGQSIVVIGTSSSTLSSTGTTLGNSIVNSLGASSTLSATSSSPGQSQGSAVVSWRWKEGLEVWLGFAIGVLGVAAVL